MKRIIYLLLLFPFICFGQVPQSMSYQAMATNSEGFEIANSQISVKVSIIEETPSGLVSFVEEHTVMTNDYGMFSINIGQGNSQDDYTAVDWSKSNFLKIELDDNMDGAYSLMGVSAFNSVPYSFMAENVMNPDELKDNLGDHTATQTLDMDSNYVSQVLAPELPLDAANKQYVDDMIGDITTGAGEIVHFNFTDGNYTEFTHMGKSYLFLFVVPDDVIISVTTSFSLIRYINDEPLPLHTSVYPELKRDNHIRSSRANLSNGYTFIGFPGDTVCADICCGNFIEFNGYYQVYSVSATQIDENTTSYSMVSLDEEASSLGGTITEGTGSSSSQERYILSEQSSEILDLAGAMSYCRNLEEGGNNDWYLPTFDEFINIYSGKVFLDTLLNDLESYNEGFYWSSSPNFGGNWGSYYTFNPILHNYMFSSATNTNPFICIRKD